MAGDMDQVALVNVLPTAQPGPPHAAAIEDMGEAALDHLCTEFESCLRYSR